MDKGTEHFILYAQYGKIQNIFFKYFTHLGEIYGILCCIPVFYLLRNKAGFISTAIALVLGNLSTTALKYLMAMPRPASTTLAGKNIQFIEGVEPLYHLSFPSGHTEAAFCLFFSLCFFTDKKGLQILYFLAALLVAISRMYLLQHFMADVLAGAWLGVIVATFSYYVIYPKVKEKITPTA